MKTFLASILFVLLIIMITTGYEGLIKQKDSTIDSLNIKLNKSLAIDTLYRKHLEKCSFISKDQLYINKNGFLKVRKVRYLSEQ